MASHVFVIDSTFKRTQIKVTPGKYLREVLEEACHSRKLSPEGYTLKTQANKAVDLSQPFRLSGLSAGAKLQLTQASKSPGVVSVALQLPERDGGGRLNDKFPSSTSLWQVLRKYEDGAAGTQTQQLNFTQRGVLSGAVGQGRVVYDQPCLNVLGRTLDNFTDLQKTLAQLGLNGGTAMMRLSFKATDTPIEEAMQRMTAYFADSDTSRGPSAATPAEASSANGVAGLPASVPVDDASTSTASDARPEDVENETMSDAQATVTAPSDAQTSDQQPPPATANTENDPPTPQAQQDPASQSTNSQKTINGISVYRPPSSSTPAAALAPDDPSVFEPTIDHAKAHQAALNRDTRNKRLLSDKELESQEAERQQGLSAVTSVTVRVRYPDQSQIETTVTPADTAADLYAKVMDTLAAAPEPFELRFLGAKNHETLPQSSNKRLVKDFGFRGKVLVTLVWSDEASARARQGPSLKEEYRALATDLKVELASQRATGVEAHETAMKKPEGGGGGSGKGAGKADLETKMKKFLGFGKK